MSCVTYLPLKETQLVTSSLFLASINCPRRPVCTIYYTAFFADHAWFKIALKLWGWLLYGQTAFLSSLKLGHSIRTCRPICSSPHIHLELGARLILWVVFEGHLACADLREVAERAFGKPLPTSLNFHLGFSRLLSNAIKNLGHC